MKKSQIWALLFPNLVVAAALGRRHEVLTSSPTPAPPPDTAAVGWDAGATRDFPIHQSCNATERALLHKGLDDAAALAAHAKDHVLRFGNGSVMYQKYFGTSPSAAVIGWYDKIVSADKGQTLFRCDNPDGNCAQAGWGGHWRGENGTSQTVICPLSYQTRHFLEGMCGFGYTVAEGDLAFFWGSDLIHRIFHMPSMSEGAVGHFAETYTDCLELARTNPEKTAINTHTLQYFAVEVYAYDISLPGEGCAGKIRSEERPSIPQTPPTPPAPSLPSAPPPSTVQSAPANSHTHADGVVHCA